MPSKPLRCEEAVIPDGDMTGENAIECGAVALACADCGDAAGCEAHAQLCRKCGQPMCIYCEDEHSCPVAGKQAKAA